MREEQTLTKDFPKFLDPSPGAMLNFFLEISGELLGRNTSSLLIRFKDDGQRERFADLLMDERLDLPAPLWYEDALAFPAISFSTTQLSRTVGDLVRFFRNSDFGKPRQL